jgi:hypothetical protein
MSGLLSHGPWCNFRTRPWRCKCGARVFFGTCDHGSKVFFDHLGDPWPLHRCGYYSPPMTEREIAYRQSIEEQNKRSRDTERRERALQAYENFRLSCPCGMESKEVRGVIVELEESAKISHILNIPIGAKNWGEEVARLTMADVARWVIVEAGCKESQPPGYQFYMEYEKVNGEPVFPGDRLRVLLKGIVVVRRPAIWYGAKCWKC